MPWGAGPTSARRTGRQRLGHGLAVVALVAVAASMPGGSETADEVRDREPPSSGTTDTADRSPADVDAGPDEVASEANGEDPTGTSGAAPEAGSRPDTAATPRSPGSPTGVAAPPATVGTPSAAEPAAAPADPPRPEPSGSPVPPPTSTPLPAGARPAFFEAFDLPSSMGRFDFDIYHRDDVLIEQQQWPGDHVADGPDDSCTAPDQKRTVHRGTRDARFNSEWIYRCAPDGDPARAHLMTSIGDTSGYSIGAFSPSQTFSRVKEVRWDINLTDLGTRKFPEVKIVPVRSFDFQDLPCAIEWLPCDTSLHADLGSVGTSFFNQEVHIHNGIDDDRAWEVWGQDVASGDPAIRSVLIRRAHFFRDNGNGTLTFGVEQPDGAFFEYTRPGRFPSGDVRVVFADHNYTPTKDNPGITFTWHWDNLAVYDGSGAVQASSVTPTRMALVSPDGLATTTLGAAGTNVVSFACFVREQIGVSHDPGSRSTFV